MPSDQVPVCKPRIPLSSFGGESLNYQRMRENNGIGFPAQELYYSNTSLPQLPTYNLAFPHSFHSKILPSTLPQFF